jgi:hypothetical protein
MKQTLSLLFLVLLLLACEEQVINVEEYKDWVRLSIPKGEEALALAGDIENTLLVATKSKAFYTTDMGQTWVESKDFQGPVFGLLHRGDTIVALFNKTKNERGLPEATLGYLYTLDLGRSWHFDESGRYLKATVPIGAVASPLGIKYRIHREEGDSLALGKVVTPSVVEKWPHLENEWVPLSLPVAMKVNHLYLDRNNRLYLAASYGTFSPEGIHQSPTDKSPAWVFISKQILPQ